MKGLMLLSNNMEDLEAIGTYALLERSGIQIETATFSRDKRVKAAYGTIIEADMYARQINYDEFDFLVIPGGKYVIETIATDNTVKSVIKGFSDKNKMVAAICAAPMFLGELGLLKDKEYTCFPGCENEAFQGTYLKDKKTHTSGNIITGRSAGAVHEFAAEIVKFVKGERASAKLLKDIYY